MSHRKPKLNSSWWFAQMRAAATAASGEDRGLKIEDGQDLRNPSSIIQPPSSALADGQQQLPPSDRDEIEDEGRRTKDESKNTDAHG